MIYPISSVEVERITAVLKKGPVRLSELNQCSECGFAIRAMLKEEVIVISKDGLVKLNKL